MKLSTAIKREEPHEFIVEEKKKKRYIFNRLLPLIIFILIVLIITSFFLWYKYKPRAVGVLYGETFTIASKRSALIKNLDVKLGDRVLTKQLLVKLDTNTLESERKVLENSIDIARYDIDAKSAELSLKQQELNLKLDDNLIFRAIDIQVAKSSLNEDMAKLQSTIELIKGVKKQFDRTKELVGKKAISQSEHDIIDAKYNSLLKQIEFYQKVVNSGEQRYNTAIKRYDNYKQKKFKIPVDEILMPLRQQVKLAEVSTRVVDEKIHNSMLLSPVNGYVSTIEKRSGGGVSPGETILTLKTFSQNIVEAYVMERWLSYFTVGDALTLYPRSSVFTGVKGKITKISHDIVIVPSEYLSRNDISNQKGARILIQLDKKWDSYLGTTFDIVK